MNFYASYLNSPKIKKVLSTKPNEEGFSLVELVVVIAVLAILSAVAIPAFVGVQANARAAAVKNGLVNTVKECVVREATSESTKLLDAQSANGTYTGYKKFAKISATDAKTAGGSTNFESGDTCFAAEAEPSDSESKEATFRITMEKATGKVAKYCEASGTSAPGCDVTNSTWK